jgi:hypothetical protein
MLDLRETAGAFGKLVHDQDGPLRTYDLCARSDRARLRLVNLEHRASSHIRIIPAVPADHR